MFNWQQAYFKSGTPGHPGNYYGQHMAPPHHPYMWGAQVGNSRETFSDLFFLISMWLFYLSAANDATLWIRPSLTLWLWRHVCPAPCYECSSPIGGLWIHLSFSGSRKSAKIYFFGTSVNIFVFVASYLGSFLQDGMMVSPAGPQGMQNQSSVVPGSSVQDHGNTDVSSEEEVFSVVLLFFYSSHLTFS